MKKNYTIFSFRKLNVQEDEEDENEEEEAQSI